MQITTGIRSVLSASKFYEVLQNVLGATKAFKWLAANIWKIQPGEKVIDMGCGPGTIRNILPLSIKYIGFDISQNYIETAREKFPESDIFIESTVGQLLAKPDERLFNVDVVLCNGVFHHLSDTE